MHKEDFEETEDFDDDVPDDLLSIIEEEDWLLFLLFFSLFCLILVSYFSLGVCKINSELQFNR
jgi:hypothetical protein